MVKLTVGKKTASIGVIFGLLLAILAGFTAFYAVVVPQLINISTLSLAAVVGFAALAGILSFFAPCSVAIFPSFMGYYMSETEDTHLEALKSGSVASLGMILFYGLLGITVSYIGGLASVQSILNIGIPLMAAILGGVGAYFLAGKTITARRLSEVGGRFMRRDGKTNQNLFLFGFGYSMSSIACIFPVFLLLIAYPLITGNVVLGITAFLAFAAGKSVLMIAATVLTAESKSRLLTSKSKNFNYVKKGSGLLLILVALYLVYYTFALYGLINPII